jgi:hypothetical protein
MCTNATLCGRTIPRIRASKPSVPLLELTGERLIDSVLTTNSITIMGKYYVRTAEQLEKLIEEEKVPASSRDMIKMRLDRMIKSRFLLLETTKSGILRSISDIEVSQVPLEIVPDKEIDSALYL